MIYSGNKEEKMRSCGTLLIPIDKSDDEEFIDVSKNLAPQSLEFPQTDSPRVSTELRRLSDWCGNGWMIAFWGYRNPMRLALRLVLDDVAAWS